MLHDLKLLFLKLHYQTSNHYKAKDALVQALLEWETTTLDLILGHTPILWHALIVGQKLIPRYIVIPGEQAHSGILYHFGGDSQAGAKLFYPE